ncbi:MAG TPA: hypothetical protein PL070_18120 [Flavobacteriales bacterium]|nr:hypothetical protein [Flavobacteriales bacterium]
MNAYLDSLRQEYLLTSVPAVRKNYVNYFTDLDQGSYLLMKSAQTAEIDIVLDYYGVIAQALLLRVANKLPLSLAHEITTVAGNRWIREQTDRTSRLLVVVVHHLVRDPKFAQSAIRSLPDVPQVDLFERSLLIAKPITKGRFFHDFHALLEGREVENLSMKELRQVLKEPKEIAKRLADRDGFDTIGRAVIGMFDYLKFAVSFKDLMEELGNSLLIRSILVSIRPLVQMAAAHQPQLHERIDEHIERNAAEFQVS